MQAPGTIVPTSGFDVLPPAILFTNQVTAAFGVPVTVEVSWNCSVVPTVAPLGLTLTRTPESRFTFTTAKTVVTAWLVATTLTVGGLGSVAGAV